MTAVKFWTNVQAKDPLETVQVAQRFERDGWDGAVFYDSQCLFPEVWAVLAICAQATKKITLATGVTNPITRHPSVTAAAAATIQAISGGRFVLGLGRGDSALAYVGAAPMVMGKFEPYMAMLQSYLRGDLVPLADAGALIQGADRTFEKVAIHEPPEGSSLTWLKGLDAPKVPLEAMVTGPKAIEAAARVADAVVFGLAAERNRIAWGIDIARRATEAAGKNPATIAMGAYVPVVVHPEVSVARELARPLVASMARFSVMNRQVVGPTQGNQQEMLDKIANVYDMRAHGRGGVQGEVLDGDFIDQFGIVGPPDHCVRRFRELIDLGIARFTITLPQGENPDLERAYELLCTDVLPRLRA